jgi:tryptophan-rich sensory protein
VWTPLYATIAWATAEGIDRPRDAGDDAATRRIATAFAANMALNAGWNLVFFRAHRPWAALVEICALEASVLDLAHQVNRQSPRAGRALLAYAAWTGFAGALTAAIAWENRRGA